MQLTIEKLIYGGDGLARIPASGDERRGKTVFVPYVLAGEKVEASTVEERKGFMRASLTSILEPSPERVTPPCPHFGRCGGCQYQHASYPAQLEAKRQILHETVLRGAKIELPAIEVHSAEPYEFRNRTRMKIAVEPEFSLGYHRAASHEIEAVRHCPIASPLINRAIALLWELAPQAASHTALREVQFFASHDDSALLVELYIHHATAPETLSTFARVLRRMMPEIAGVAIFASGASADEEDGSLEAARRLNRAGAPHIEGSSKLVYQVGRESYQVSAGAFFQTNRFLVERLVALATANRSGRSALDLYAGVGLFTLPLSHEFERVTAVEVAPNSSVDLAFNAAVPHIRTFSTTTEDYLASARGRWDFVIADPPRAGLGERAAKSLASLKAPQMTYVSCDPATLARDLVTLLAAGYRVEQAHLVDLFPQSYHMETILYLAR